MTRTDLDALRSQCRAALEGYRALAADVLEHSKGGKLPPAADLHAEEVALYEFAKLRRELLDALDSLYRPRH